VADQTVSIPCSNDKHCACPTHYWSWLDQPHVKAGLERARKVKVCEGFDTSRSGKTIVYCKVTENLRPVCPGASADDGTEVFFMVCEKHKYQYI
jgi:hypothetical protein